MKKIILTVLASIFLISCATLKSVPEDLTAAQIIQMGQNYLVTGDYKSAELCYSTVLERYGTNAATYVEAKYELGNVYYKSHQYDKAYDTFTELLDIYGYSQGQLPGAYKKLAQIGLDKIPEKKLKNKEAEN
ncbi:MAG: tetratricopeptide repeat protein [Treponema sp.]|nr:tetratricopeptide repeat protein [Treponema sp.]